MRKQYPTGASWSTADRHECKNEVICVNSNGLCFRKSIIALPAHVIMNWSRRDGCVRYACLFCVSSCLFVRHAGKVSAELYCRRLRNTKICLLQSCFQSEHVTTKNSEAETKGIDLYGCYCCTSRCGIR